MSCHLISGLPRNGKSYYCVTRIVDDLVDSERSIYTNLPVNPDYIARIVALRKCNKRTEDYLDLIDGILSRLHVFKKFASRADYLDFKKKNPLYVSKHLKRNRKHDKSMSYSQRLLYPFEYIADYWNHTKANSLFYLDECYQIWNYLDSSERGKEAKDKRKELQNYMRMHGHDGDDIYLITHKERDLDNFILDTLSYRINVRNSKYWPIVPQEILDKYWWLGWLATLRWPVQFFILRSFIGDEKLPHRTFFRACDRRIFKCYDSHSRPNGLKNRGFDSKVASSDLGKTYFSEMKEWFFDALPALMVLTMLVFTAAGVYKGLRGMMNPRHSKTVISAPVVQQEVKKDVPGQGGNVQAKKESLQIKSISPSSIHFSNGLTLKKGGVYEIEDVAFNVVSVSRSFV